MRVWKSPPSPPTVSIPWPGNRGIYREKARINMIPSQKTGMAKPKRDRIVTTAPPKEDGRWATITPVRTPIKMAKNMAVRIRRAVCGIFSRMSSRTGFP